MPLSKGIPKFGFFFVSFRLRPNLHPHSRWLINELGSCVNLKIVLISEGGNRYRSRPHSHFLHLACSSSLFSPNSCISVAVWAAFLLADQPADFADFGFVVNKNSGY